MKLKNGLTLVQLNPDRAIDLRDDSADFGWLFRRGAEKGAEWERWRKLAPIELQHAIDWAESRHVDYRPRSVVVP
ncbi:MAG: hypothetical protein KJN72_12300 [Woeseia sp.]|nr:hypothetical protein [Woeseia sp.]